MGEDLAIVKIESEILVPRNVSKYIVNNQEFNNYTQANRYKNKILAEKLYKDIQKVETKVPDFFDTEVLTWYYCRTFNDILAIAGHLDIYLDIDNKDKDLKEIILPQWIAMYVTYCGDYESYNLYTLNETKNTVNAGIEFLKIFENIEV